jgi:glycosyltransferase involved in cell wall biosynthesis
MRSVFVVIPSLTLSAPVKGAVALCNGLSDRFPVSLVSLKNGVVSGGIDIDPRVNIISLAKEGNWFGRYRTYRSILERSGDRNNLVSISYCFSGDAFNSLFSRHAVIMSSVRGNLPENYRIEFGPPGKTAAYFHFRILKRFDRVIAMSSAMAEQLNSSGITNIEIISNFLDEKTLEAKRVQTKKEGEIFRFMFLGRLTRLKSPQVPLFAVASLRKEGIECAMEFIGDGPMRGELKELSKKLGLNSSVVFHGHKEDPYGLLQRADCLVLPSRTEGTSRAVLESLFFGIPCIVRNIDGVHELITPGVNGYLFDRDEDLAGVMAGMTGERRKNFEGSKLLPGKFRQEINIKHFMELIGS